MVTSRMNTYPWHRSSQPLPPALEEALRTATGFASDTSTYRDGDIFVALKRRGYDSHDQVSEIVQRNPAAMIVSDPALAGDARTILVEDTSLVHWQLAVRFRARFPGLVIAVGGSVGKTSTKDFLYQLLASRFHCIATRESQNCHVGVPRTLERLRKGVDIAIVEIGIDGPRQMRPLATLVAPDISVLTPLAPEHLRQLGSMEQVMHEELELWRVTQERGGGFYALDQEPWLARVEAALLQRATLLSRHVPSISQACGDLPPVMQANAHLAVGVALACGMSASACATVLKKIEIPEGRGRLVRMPGGPSLLCDYYNASPLSMQEALAYASALAAKNAWALHLFLGDMLDLGAHAAAYHRDLLPLIVAAAPRSIVLVGENMGLLLAQLRGAGFVTTWALRFEDLQPDKIQEHLNISDLHLIKGSRGMGLERALAHLTRPH